MDSTRAAVKRAPTNRPACRRARRTRPELTGDTSYLPYFTLDIVCTHVL